jgi:hypothetical protein
MRSATCIEWARGTLRGGEDDGRGGCQQPRCEQVALPCPTLGMLLLGQLLCVFGLDLGRFAVFPLNRVVHLLAMH